jgi:hypothetical protein
MNAMSRFRQIRWIVGCALLALAGGPGTAAGAANPADEFLRGYATAVVQMSFPAAARSLRVENGVVTVQDAALSEEEMVHLGRMLAEAPGFVRLERVETPAAGASAAAPKAHPEAGPFAVFLARKTLFQPLLADPRWPHFSAAFQRYVDDRQVRDVGATTFGESFSLVRFGGPWDATMELGIQAGVFAIFDLDAESSDLINADYLVGVPLTTKWGNLSNHTSVFHQSSHLGDEFLLRGRADKRVNLSYEAVGSLFSYNLPAGFRVYAGGGYIFRKEPGDLEPWSTQVGLEFASPWPLLGGALRPVAGVDVQHREEGGWETDLSLRAGVQFQNPNFFSRKMQLLLEYYRGQSPNGQFYERNIESLGIGVHFFIE